VSRGNPLRPLAAALVLAVGVVGCSGSTPPPAAGGSGASHSGTPAATAPLGKVTAVTVGHLPFGVSRAVAVASGGAILVLGGLGAGDTTTPRVVRFDLASLQAAPVGDLAEGVHDAAGAWLAGHAVVFGGGAAQSVAAVQSWSGAGGGLVGRLPDARSDLSAAVVGATAYVVGGFDGQGMTRDVLATQDGRTFRVVARLAIGVRYAAVAALDGALWVFGGQLATTESTSTGAQSAAIQKVDLRTGRVTVVGHLPESLGHAAAFVVGGHLLVAGGRHRTVASDRIWAFDPAKAAVTAVGRLPLAVSDQAVVVVGSTAWLLGGETTGPGSPTTGVVAVRLSR
jgi:N-acetylneuraminic acid mutarotase